MFLVEEVPVLKTIIDEDLLTFFNIFSCSKKGFLFLVDAYLSVMGVVWMGRESLSFTHHFKQL
jgi:hypothetical protein